jgi:Ca2+-binding EF-hand superfamily protein
MRTFAISAVAAVAMAAQIKEDLTGVSGTSVTDAPVVDDTIAPVVEEDTTDDVPVVDDTVFDDSVNDVPVDVTPTSRATDWHSWIGKYKFAGATDEWLEGMFLADSDRDGNVTLEEAIQAAESIGATVDDEIYNLAATEPNVDWSHDMDLLTALLPLGFDHDGDGRLDWEETQAFFNAISQEELGKEVFMDNATLDYDDLTMVVSDIRYDPLSSRPTQLEGMTNFMQMLIGFDTNGDGVISLREYIAAMQEAGLGRTLDVEAMVAENGEDFDWIHDDHLIAQILTADFDVTDYYGLYDMWATAGMPWITDEWFATSEHPNVGTTFEAIVAFVDTLKYDHDGEWLFPSEEWVQLEDRFDETFKSYWENVVWESYFRPDWHEMITGGNIQGAWDDLMAR